MTEGWKGRIMHVHHSLQVAQWLFFSFFLYSVFIRTAHLYSASIIMEKLFSSRAEVRLMKRDEWEDEKCRCDREREKSFYSQFSLCFLPFSTLRSGEYCSWMVSAYMCVCVRLVLCFIYCYYFSLLFSPWADFSIEQTKKKVEGEKREQSFPSSSNECEPLAFNILQLNPISA